MTRLGISLPILQAPMAGANGVGMAAAVSSAGGLGALPCGMLNPQGVLEQVGDLRSQTNGAINLNFFCHVAPTEEDAAQRRWRAALAPYYKELGIPGDTVVQAPARLPFDENMCRVVEQAQPQVVSFHFGLPEAGLLARVKATGAVVLSSATTVREARWLEKHGCDVIVAQGCEAGGHRGMFLEADVGTQIGTMALVPQVVDAVQCPVVAAGGISDSRGIVAALALGADAVQIGTAYLLTPQSLVSPLHRRALEQAEENFTALTNLFSGRAARGLTNRLMQDLGPLADQVSAFPNAGTALAPLKAAAEAQGKADFSSLWSGQNNHGLQAVDAGELTRTWAADALGLMNQMAPKAGD